MHHKLLFILLFLTPVWLTGQIRTVHVYVALCDNEHQGIVPVPEKFGNGKDPANNLYWGAAYGVKTYLKSKSPDWQYIASLESNESHILDRVLFKHKESETYLLADAYDGEEIKTCVKEFLLASNGQLAFSLDMDTLNLDFGGSADLIAYIGHDGLMDFDVDVQFNRDSGKNMPVIILACYSKAFFSNQIREANADPILWTTHLMAPEAYTLDAAMGGWILSESPDEIEERAAQAYDKYQKCGIRGARNLFTNGF